MNIAMNLQSCFWRIDPLDTEENCKRLAIVIQQAIEDELEAIELEAS
jgi:hypothetical protein